LEALRTLAGQLLPPRAKAEIVRELTRLEIVVAQLVDVEKERDGENGPLAELASRTRLSSSWPSIHVFPRGKRRRGCAGQEPAHDGFELFLSPSRLVAGAGHLSPGTALTFSREQILDGFEFPNSCRPMR